jgi:ligand-binding SRPBCC domain-containing protein
MNVYVLRRAQTIARPLDTVFPFFARPENLERISPKDIGFTILTPGPIEMKAGALIDYTIRLMGVTLRWTTLITSYDPPRSFTDEQLRGPYSFWHHRHVFREVDDGTEILDEVHYALRGGMLAPLIHRLFVRKQLDKIFDHRARIIVRELMGTETEVGS